MASIFVKGGKWWASVKGDKKPGKWSHVPTPYLKHPDNEDKALRWAVAAQAAIDKRNTVGSGGPTTVATYAKRWLEEPSRAALSSIADITGHVNNHIIPRLGELRIIDVRPHHIRDFLRALKTDAELDLAPKTILNVFGTLRTMFADAVVDELIVATPVAVKRQDLPEKVDKDPEWREKATYERAEIVQLLSSSKVPPERRIQYALKALAGLRHGEVAGLRWHHWTENTEPLGKLSIARTYQSKRTKTKVTRPVPVHPQLLRMLTAWRALWPQIYGREPEPDDFVVPTRTMRPVDPSDAVIAMKLDLTALELRLDAGEHRDRGGHDLRAWFITSALADGAAPDALYAVTHTKKRDVASGYNRQRWSRLCEAVSALQLELGDDPLAVVTGFVTRERSLRRRWYLRGDPDGIRTRRSASVKPRELPQPHENTGRVAAPCDLLLADLVTRVVTGPKPKDGRPGRQTRR